MAFSISDLSWPLAFIIFSFVLGLVGILYIIFRYKKKNKKKNLLMLGLGIAMFVSFLLVLLDIFDVIGPPGGSWVVESYGWLVLLLIAGAIIGLYATFIVKVLPKSEQKLLRIAYEKIAKFNPALEIIEDNEGFKQYPVRAFQVIETRKQNNGEGLLGSLAYFILEFKDTKKALVVLDLYSGYMVKHIPEPTEKEINALRKREIVMFPDADRTQVEHLFSGMKTEEQHSSNDAEDVESEE